MKPQASQEVSPRSSPTPEGASTQEVPSADASLENLATHLEQLNIAKIHNTPFNRAELKDIITGLEDDLAAGRWINAYYADTDLKLMPALVEQANRKYPEMNLKLALTAEEFAHTLKETIESGVKSS